MSEQARMGRDGFRTLEDARSQRLCAAFTRTEKRAIEAKAREAGKVPAVFLRDCVLRGLTLPA